MKRNKIFGSLLGTLLVTAGAGMLSSCTRDFQEVNTNPLLPNDSILIRDNLSISANLPTLLFQPVYTAMGGTGAANNYQVIDNLMMQSWMGYLAPRDAKWGANNLSQFSFSNQGWVNGAFSNNTINSLGPWIQLKESLMGGPTPHPEVFAIAQIAKIMSIHRGIDMFGAIPYSQVGSGAFQVAYDAPETTYTSFFEELTAAVNELKNWSEISAPDYVYEGNAAQWAKLGNSLMLRLAMRVRFVAPALSQKYAEQAANDPAGLILNNADNAQIDQASGINPVNSLFIVAKSYDDTRMGASIYVYLKGYNDPRLNAYFEPYKEGSINTAVPPAIPTTGAMYAQAAGPKVGNWDPSIWMTASEVNFLLAEAALAGYNVPGSAQQYYEDGVKASFDQYALGGASDYLNGETGPIAFRDITTWTETKDGKTTVHEKEAEQIWDADAPSTVTVKWDEGLSDEQKLEKIMTQKYLALYPNGVEAWSEWRRTGYPRLIPANGNVSTFGVVTSDGHKDGVRSLPMPQSEIDTNKANVQDAINKYRGGSNQANVNVWWDVKVKD